MLNTENIAVYLIFTLVIIVALFNLISTDHDDLDKGETKNPFKQGTEIRIYEKIFLLQGTFIECFWRNYWQF
jgi:lipoprotein-releasing system permease protein